MNQVEYVCETLGIKRVELAKMLGVTNIRVNQMRTSGIPLKHQFALEKMTKRKITVKKLQEFLPG